MLNQLKGNSLSDICIRITLKMMKILKISKCCFVFTPRQGTMMVAVVELSLSSIALFLLLLAAMNAQEIASMASAELKDLESSWSSEFGEEFQLPFYYMNNEKKMLTGQHLATIMMTVAYAGVILCIIHILACLMLLYGALYDISNFLLPWLSTDLLSIVTCSLFLISLLFFHHHKCIIPFYIAGMASLGLEIYAWLIVFSYYREISQKNLSRDIENIVPSQHLHNDVKAARADI